MRERVAAIGGKFAIESKLGNGCRIKIDLTISSFNIQPIINPNQSIPKNELTGEENE
jgi:signal transduction histidine kinase